MKRVIISAYKSNLPIKTNQARHDTLKHLLTNLGFLFIECVQCYKGLIEKSLIVSVPWSITLDYFLSLGDSLAQESLIYINDANEAFLHVLNADSSTSVIDLIGQWQEVPKHEALINGSYTLAEDKYYIIK